MPRVQQRVDVKSTLLFVHFLGEYKYQPRKNTKLSDHIDKNNQYEFTCFCPANINASLASIVKRNVIK